MDKPIKYDKYHGLGNDYIVIDPEECCGELSAEMIRLACHRNYGLGADGILLGPFADNQANARVQIFNPDGSEAEKSGNGLRIFARFLWDREFAGKNELALATAGGTVHCRLDEVSGLISIDMGTVTFQSEEIPVSGAPREVLDEEISAGKEALRICAAGIGNPHCVVFRETLSSEETCRLGPMLENHALFPNRTNVQFVKPLDLENIQIEIWERGAGYTLASGSSSAASAALAHRMGFCGPHITVHMPGGKLAIHVDADNRITLKGPVVRVSQGHLHPELFCQKLPA
ncbi:MAG: diaminopimelate epimerase [Desulfosalsimonadaceae bacterium]